MKINNIKRFISILLIVCLFGTSAPAFAEISSPIAMTNDTPYSFSKEIASKSQDYSAPPMAGMPVISEEAVKNYILGIGDVLDVHIIVGDNALSLNYNFVVSPQGIIFFPNIGNIKLSGLSIKFAENELKRNIKKYYKQDFRLSLILKQPKTIKVYITGNAVRPGPFSLYDGTRISEVIKSCGGASGGGSTRTVIIRRKNMDIVVDLYSSLLSGDISKDIFVKSEDIIEFPPVSDQRVTVLGEASRPGIYEIKNGEKLKDLLKISGFTQVNSSLSSVVVLKRTREREQFSEYKINVYDLIYKGDETQNLELHDGDIVAIPSIETHVYIYGEVSRSGRFSYLPGKKLSDYLNLAGGPSARANLGYVSITRNESSRSKVFHINASDILYRGITNNDIEIMAGDIISVPANFFYFSDFSSFANTILLGLTLYATVSNYLKK